MNIAVMTALASDAAKQLLVAGSKGSNTVLVQTRISDRCPKIGVFVAAQEVTQL